MNIIDYLYFKFVALRKLKKAAGDRFLVAIEPRLQFAYSNGEWLKIKNYKIFVQVGCYEWQEYVGTAKEMLKRLIEIAGEI
jgi:hypothetical protein